MEDISESWVASVSAGDEPLSRYLSVEQDDEAAYCSIVYVLHNTEDAQTIYGAYYGRVGGGVNDGGFFSVDDENNVKHLDFSDVDELGETMPALQSLYEFLISRVWDVMDEEDDTLILNETGKEMAAQADEGVFMSGDFDGDALADISKLWRIGVRFEK